MPELLARFHAAPRGVLLGTQMVAKGHDFPDVTLGVVLDADSTLRFPDFRAEERTFALIAQLAGRAGRGPKGGRVLLDSAVAAVAVAGPATDEAAEGVAVVPHRLGAVVERRVGVEAPLHLCGDEQRVCDDAHGRAPSWFLC